MGLVYAEITLVNGGDQYMNKKNLIADSEVRKIKVKMLVDSGAYMLAINEETMHQLGLVSEEERSAQMADGSIVTFPVVGPINVYFENRKATCSAMVLPGSTEMLLGAIPMEEMDVLIHPTTNRLIVNPAHPNIAQLSMK
jgi:clan AA aspartic protease